MCRKNAATKIYNKFKMTKNLNVHKLAEQLKRDGYIILKKYYDPQLIKKLKILIKYNKNLIEDVNYKENIAPVGYQNLIKNDEILNNLPYYDTCFLNIATQGLHLDIIGEILNDPYYGLIPKEKNNFILGQSNARNNLISLPFHNDVRLKTPGNKTWSLQTMLSLDKLTSNNGCLIIRPFSHLSEMFPNFTQNYSDAINIETSPGDIIIFYSKLDHATASNKSQESSWAILNTYRSWWVKPQYDFHNMINKEHIKQITIEQYYMLGGCSIPSSNPVSPSSMRLGYERLLNEE
jgi:ectoine hydroxylase-related dioxygenase (phytanoyl-CoA dioxygenase family)